MLSSIFLTGLFLYANHILFKKILLKNLYQLYIHVFDIENLNRIYERGSRNIMFGKVFDELAEKFPEAKIGRLKDLIQSKT